MPSLVLVPTCKARLAAAKAKEISKNRKASSPKIDSQGPTAVPLTSLAPGGSCEGEVSPPNVDDSARGGGNGENSSNGTDDGGGSGGGQKGNDSNNSGPGVATGPTVTNMLSSVSSTEQFTVSKHDLNALQDR